MTEQLALIPERPVAGKDRVIALAELPPDEELYGDPPSASMVASVRNYGVLQRILLIEGRDGYVVAAGRNRIKAARAAGLSHIPARIFPAGWTPAAVLTLIENGERRRNPVADLVAIEDLIAHGADKAAICAATGLPPQVVDARLRLHNLIPALRTALYDGRIRISVAERAAKLSPDRQEVLAARLGESGKLRVRDVQEASQVAAREAVQTLPAELFAPRSWSENAEVLVNQLRQCVPTDVVRVHALLDELADLFAQHESTGGIDEYTYVG